MDKNQIKTDCLNKAADLMEKGWQMIPIDDVETAEIGVLCFRYVKPDGTTINENEFYTLSNEERVDLKEENEILKWPVFDEPFRPEIKIVRDVKEIIAFLKDSEEIYLCDDPKTLKMGFVTYDKENHKSKVLKIKIVDIKRSDPEDSQYISDVRKEMMEKYVVSQKERFECLEDLRKYCHSE